MKLLVDVPEKKLKSLKRYLEKGYTLGMMELAVLNGKPLPKCKDCKYFERDAFVTVDGIQLIVGHEVCTKWGAGCKTKGDGYCFMFEPKEVDE